MTSDDRDEDSEQHSENKWYNHRPTKLTIAISGIVVYVFFVLVDVREIWPWWPLAAIGIGIPATIAALYLEAFATEAISFRTFLVSSVLATGGGVIIYIFAPRDSVPPVAQIPEVEMVGTLQPGADPTPPNRCPATTSPGAWKIMFGDSAVQFAEPTEVPLLRVGSCHVLTLKRDAGGISVTADLFDSAGRLIASIKNNEFHALSGAHTRIEREHDLSKLIVYGDDKEVLNVRYLNSSTVRIRGVFGCPGHALIAIKDNEPIPGFFMHGNCTNVMAGVHIGDAFMAAQ